MCGSMVDIQSATAENRPGKKERRKIGVHTAVPTTAVPTTVIPTTAIPTTGILTSAT